MANLWSFLRTTALIREVGEQPVDARLVMQDVVQLISVCGIVRRLIGTHSVGMLPSYSDARLAPFSQFDIPFCWSLPRPACGNRTNTVRIFRHLLHSARQTSVVVVIC